MSRAKLLLADDSVAIRKVVDLTFADEGIEVFAVADAQSAMKKFVEVQPDIVLVDVGLEGTSGYQICEMIKQDDATRDIPVLLLVGSFEPFDQDAAERACADGFLTKPFQSVRELVNRVNELLGRDAQPPEPEPIAVESQAVTAPASSHTGDTADIENLYASSFAETVEIKDFDTVEDLFNDNAIDDELIETLHPNEPASLNGSNDVAPLEIRSEIMDFDWSPGGKVDPHAAEVPSLELDSGEGDLVSSSGDAETSQLDLEPIADQGEAGDNEMVSQPIGDYGEAQAVIETQFEEPEETPVSWSDGVDTEGEPEQAQTQRSSADAEPDDLPIEPAEEPKQEENVFPPVQESLAEPSAELIALLAERVLERLSDRVIREVAQEAVPRIAEKLIREALDEGGERK